MRCNKEEEGKKWEEEGNLIGSRKFLTEGKKLLLLLL